MRDYRVYIYILMSMPMHMKSKRSSTICVAHEAYHGGGSLWLLIALRPSHASGTPGARYSLSLSLSQTLSCLDRGAGGLHVRVRLLLLLLLGRRVGVHLRLEEGGKGGWRFAGSMRFAGRPGQGGGRIESLYISFIDELSKSPKEFTGLETCIEAQMPRNRNCKQGGKYQLRSPQTRKYLGVSRLRRWCCRWSCLGLQCIWK